MTTHPTPPDQTASAQERDALSFTISDVAGTKIISWPDNGCRPATEAEIEMWNARLSAPQPEPCTDVETISKVRELFRLTKHGYHAAEYDKGLSLLDGLLTGRTEAGAIGPIKSITLGPDLEGRITEAEAVALVNEAIKSQIEIAQQAEAKAVPQHTYEDGWDDAMNWCEHHDLIKEGVEIPRYTQEAEAKAEGDMVPDGFVLVPKEHTPAMRQAIMEHIEAVPSTKGAILTLGWYQDMISAAPPVQQGQWKLPNEGPAIEDEDIVECVLDDGTKVTDRADAIDWDSDAKGAVVKYRVVEHARQREQQPGDTGNGRG